LIPYPNPVKGRASKMPVNIDIAYSIRSEMGEAETAGALKFIDFLTTPEIAQDFAGFEGGPCVITSVKQSTPELRTVIDQIARRNTFLTVLNFWNPGLRPAWVPSVQNMLMTGDIDAFIKESDALIKTVYTSN
ncbi:MAG: hypothetical protein LBS48_05200, partial [Treponema sp.]|nr:hypothetical protein [Treponema sp.]